MRHRLLLGLFVLATAVASVAPAGAHNEGLPSVPLDSHNMVHVQNVPNLSGNALDFFERRHDDGTVSRYAVAANQGNGFDILDVTQPEHPVTVGRYLLPDDDPAQAQQSSMGSNFHAWVSVNPRRNIVALTVEEGLNGVPLGRTVRHNGAVGLQLVDITDVTNPRALGKVDGLDGPHTVRMIGDDHAYTSMSTWVVDYRDPLAPVAAKTSVEGHEFFEDANIPARMYVGMAGATGRWGIFDISNPATPVQLGSWPDNRIAAAHEVYPAPDSSYVGVADFTNGQLDVACPGGGVHFYDISGQRAPGASLTNPIKLGVWHAPFTGLRGGEGAPNDASCTMHSWQHHPERGLALAGLYAGGTWVFDPSSATQPDGHYAEYAGARGQTTWGNTLGHVRDAADYVNAAQWLPFDVDDPAHERLVFTNGTARGLDVYRYTGPLPPKQARLTVDGGVSGGVVTGALERYAVLTHEGWRNLPLAGEVVEVTAGTTTVMAVTDADGSFSAPLGAGASQVTVRWAGGDRFSPAQVTQQIQG